MSGKSLTIEILVSFNVQTPIVVTLNHHVDSLLYVIYLYDTILLKIHLLQIHPLIGQNTHIDVVLPSSFYPVRLALTALVSKATALK